MKLLRPSGLAPSPFCTLGKGRQRLRGGRGSLCCVWHLFQLNKSWPSFSPQSHVPKSFLPVILELMAFEFVFLNPGVLDLT
jgi:hypothetical protein